MRPSPLQEYNVTKRCSKCKQVLGIVEFHRDRYNRDGLFNRCKPCVRSYYAANKAKILTRQKINYTIHCKEKAIYNKAHSNAPTIRYCRYKSGAKRRGLSWELTFDQFMSFWQKPCFYSGHKIKTIGLDRVNNCIGYLLENVVSCCTLCNRAKNTMTQDEFIRYLNTIVEYRGVLVGV